VSLRNNLRLQSEAQQRIFGAFEDGSDSVIVDIAGMVESLERKSGDFVLSHGTAIPTYGLRNKMGSIFDVPCILTTKISK